MKINSNFFGISQEKKNGKNGKTANFYEGKNGKNRETANFNEVFEDSRLIFSSQILEKKPANLTFFPEKKRLRVSSLHAKSEKNPQNSQFLRNIQITSACRRSTTSEIRIKNLEILSKLRGLCGDYLINPEGLQGKIVKCLIKSLKTLNE